MDDRIFHQLTLSKETKGGSCPLPLMKEDSPQSEEQLYEKEKSCLVQCQNKLRSSIIFVLSILTILLNVGAMVTLPIYSAAIMKAGSAPYFMILWNTFWFAILFSLANLCTYLKAIYDKRHRNLFPTTSWKMAILVGVMYSINGILVVYASPPSRTPSYLLAIMYSTTTPYCMVFRYLILKKGEFYILYIILYN